MVSSRAGTDVWLLTRPIFLSISSRALRALFAAVISCAFRPSPSFSTFEAGSYVGMLG